MNQLAEVQKRLEYLIEVREYIVNKYELLKGVGGELEKKAALNHKKLIDAEKHTDNERKQMRLEKKKRDEEELERQIRLKIQKR